MRVLILGDSYRLNTGFGRVNAVAVKAFLDKGWEVAEIPGLIEKKKKTVEDSVKTYEITDPRMDVLGLADISNTVEDFKPDFLYMTCDPGSLTALATGIPADARVLAYVPVEGEPLSNVNWAKVLSSVQFFTCSKYGARVAKDYIGKDVRWVYHGVNHDTFNPSGRLNGKREKIRQAFEWTDKFVVSCVAQNVRRKQLPRLIEAMSILKYKYNQKDIVLYLHAVPFQNYWLEGHNLPEINNMFGVSDIVMFHPAMSSKLASIPETSDDPSNPGLADLLNATDLFVLPSQVEGFGMPIAESMACGLPVLVTEYAAGWEVASGAGKGILPYDWEIHKSGTRYANLSPEAIAKEILKLKRNPNELARMSKRGIEKAQLFQWSDYTDMLIEEAEKLVSADKVSDNTNETQDTSTESPLGTGRHISQHSGTGDLPQDSHRTKRKVKASDAQESSDKLVASSRPRETPSALEDKVLV